MRFLPASLDAVLVELDDLPQTLALHASLRDESVAGVEELVPAARTLLVRFRPWVVSYEELVRHIGQRRFGPVEQQQGTLVEIPVDYRGEDLEEVARLLGLSREELIRRHTGSLYTAAFAGFAPGFAYLSGGHPSLDVPRRTTPRTRIPAGAVALAGKFSGVYPNDSPGGWQILGTTAVPMWDLQREVPALLQPGFKVRFVDVTGRLPSAAAPGSPAGLAAARAPAPVPEPASTAALEIRSTGLQALFQDLGRHGQAGQGVSASGAMDLGALRAANRLVGNPASAACVEIVQGGFSLVSRGDTVVAFAGAEAPLRLEGANGAVRVLRSHEAVALSEGDSLTLGDPVAGFRSYLAVRGGFAVAPVLGSCSTDTLARIGPPPIRPGDVLPVRALVRGGVVGWPESPDEGLPSLREPVVLDVVLGPRTDWLTPEAVELLVGQPWTVTPQSNRIGLRLAGDVPLARANPSELPSEGTVAGAIQVPPSGQPVLFLADHPLTGGYPVIAAVAPHHLDRAGQIPIGARVRFHPVRAFRACTVSNVSTDPHYIP